MTRASAFGDRATDPRARLAAAAVVLALVAQAGCAAFGVVARPSSVTAGVTGVDRWSALLAATPAPHTAPLAAPADSALDGLYVKLDDSWPQWWKCLRCADYRPAGGLWRLQFDRGVMRIFYEVTEWRSLASFTVEGDRLRLFNDPYCPAAAGEYRWRLEAGVLSLSALDDPCSFDLRAQNLSEQTWQTCSPASGPPPRGCLASARPAGSFLPALPFNLTVQPGDARKFDDPPDLLADANSANRAPPAGIDLRHSAASIPYGVHRVLWAEGDWVEASAGPEFDAMGVGLLGDYMGWARVTFDGREVWRGDTSTLGNTLGRYGGYMELSGYDPGRHTLRVERLDLNSLPVTVMLFGFR